LPRAHLGCLAINVLVGHVISRPHNLESVAPASKPRYRSEEEDQRPHCRASRPEWR
jgi:hypothetical protein